MTGSSAAHTDLVKECLLALSARGVLCWRNPVGRAITASGAVIPFGVPGSADIIGFIPPNGRGIAVECKTGRAGLSKKQRPWQRACSATGAIYVLARSEEDVLMALEHAMGQSAGSQVNRILRELGRQVRDLAAETE